MATAALSAVLAPTRPVTDDAPAGGQGAFVRFQHGDVYWSQATGSQLVRGDILATWLATGGATGGLGFPTTSDARTPDGRGYFVRFQGGDVYWSPTTGVPYVVDDIKQVWGATGGAGGYLSFPTTSDTLVPGRDTYVRFQGGDVYGSPTTGTQIVRGEILKAWLAAGGATGSLGFPTKSDAPTADGRGYVVRFQGGDVYWSSTTGAPVRPRCDGEELLAAGRQLLGARLPDAVELRRHRRHAHRLRARPVDLERGDRGCLGVAVTTRDPGPALLQ